MYRPPPGHLLLQIYSWHVHIAGSIYLQRRRTTTTASPGRQFSIRVEGLHASVDSGPPIGIIRGCIPSFCLLNQQLVCISHYTLYGIFSAICNIYISRLCHDASPSVHLSVRLSVTEVHWRIIANLGFKFRSHFTAHCGRRAAGGRHATRRDACSRRSACGRIISRHASQC